MDVRWGCVCFGSEGHLKPTFWGEGWGVQNVEKTPTPLFGSTIMNHLVCFDSEPEKVFSGALLGT